MWTPPKNARRIESEAPAEFVKWEKIGQATLGQVKRFGENQNGGFAVLSPAILAPAMGRPRVVGEIAVGLSVDLARKLGANMTGRCVGIRFSDKEASRSSNNARRIFDVYELEAEQLGEYIEKIEPGALEQLPAIEMPPAGGIAPVGEISALEHEQDDLPF